MLALHISVDATSAHCANCRFLDIIEGEDLIKRGFCRLFTGKDGKPKKLWKAPSNPNFAKRTFWAFSRCADCVKARKAAEEIFRLTFRDEKFSVEGDIKKQLFGVCEADFKQGK